MTTPTRPRCAHGFEPGECDTNTCPNWNWRARSDHIFNAVHAPQSEGDLALLASGGAGIRGEAEQRQW